MAILYYGDHERRLLDRLLSQDRGNETWRAFYRGLATGLQRFEDELFGVVMALDLPNATHAALDIWAELVGEVRGGLTDGELRRVVSVKLQIMRCNGTVDEQLRIYRGLIGGGQTRYFPLYPAGYQIQGETAPLRPVMRRRTSRLMQSIVPAGVGAHVAEAQPLYFGFSGDVRAVGFGAGPLARQLF